MNKWIITLWVVSLLLCGCTKAQIRNNDVMCSGSTEYWTVISDYQTIVNSLLSGNFEKDYYNGVLPNALNQAIEDRWVAMISDAADGLESPVWADFGYIVNDLNNDGITELIFIRNDYTVLAIFTTIDGDPYLVDAFWSKHKGIILSTGELMSFDSSSAQDFCYTVYQLEDNMFNMKTSFGMENGTFFSTIENKKTTIPKADYEKLRALYPDIELGSKEYITKQSLEIQTLEKIGDERAKTD